MRGVSALAAGLVLLCGLLCGCPPDLDQFALAADGGRGPDAGPDGGGPSDAGDASDAGAPSDGGAADGSLAGCGQLLRCTRSCDGLFDSVLLDPDFSSFPTTLRVAAGTVRAEGGALVFERDAEGPFSSVSTQGMYADALLCARIRMPGGGEGISLNMFAVGWLTGSGGVELFLEGREEQVTFHSLEVLPEGVLLGRRDHAWGAVHEFLVLTYFSGEAAYAEVFDTVADVSFSLRGTYRGEQRAALGWLSATEPKLLEPVRVLELKIGPPSRDALAIIAP